MWCWQGGGGWGEHFQQCTMSKDLEHHEDLGLSNHKLANTVTAL